MKSIITALGLVALVALPTSAYAADYNWNGISSPYEWGDNSNWPGVMGYPDDSADTATITTQGSGWPVLENSYCIYNLTMTSASSLDLDSNTLTVVNEASFNSTNNTTAITITDSSTGGYLNTCTLRIRGDTNGSKVSVTDCTVQTGSCDCPE